MCALAFSSVAVSRTAIPSRASEARQRPPEAEEARDEKRFLRFGFSPGAWAIRAPSPWPALAVAAAWGSRQVKSRRRLSFGLSLALVPTAARAEEGLKQIGNEIFSVQLPQGFIWNEKFILAKTHLFEQSVGASDPYGKWPLEARNAWNESSLGWCLICTFWKHALPSMLQCPKAVERTALFMLAHTSPAFKADLACWGLAML
ncbi:unnamed protein product [Symbiodinium necroappetens]|uniref:Uncharacterized protein n=1 Tax=Symbiodinium necroappetens TaxID=1628268 RepID=A0A812KPL1_9DINO|nr:unnamed protein product [Symbiodinium necroappetens]